MIQVVVWVVEQDLTKIQTIRSELILSRPSNQPYLFTAKGCLGVILVQDVQITQLHPCFLENQFFFPVTIFFSTKKSPDPTWRPSGTCWVQPRCGRGRPGPWRWQSSSFEHWSWPRLLRLLHPAPPPHHPTWSATNKIRNAPWHLRGINLLLHHLHFHGYQTLYP